MSLNHEALYIVKAVGVFELPQNNLQLGLLCPALGPLKFVHVSSEFIFLLHLLALYVFLLLIAIIF